jgi:hypothetical protein
MSKWDKYRIETPQNTPINKWDRYRMPTKAKEGDSWPSLIGKSALKGVGSIADIPNLAAQGLEGLARGQAESERRKMELMGYPGSDIETPQIDVLSSRIPTSSNARKYIKDKTGVNLEPMPTTAGQRIASHAAEFAGSLGPWGMIGKGAGALNAAKLAGTGAGIGATSGALQEGGVNPLAADLASTVVAPYTAAKLNPKNIYSAFQKIPETAAKLPLKIMGLGPKGLNIEAAQAARDLGIDLPAAALTDSTLTGLADQWLGKTPFFGNRLKKKYATTEEQTLKALEDVYNKTGPAKTPEIESQIANLYNESVSTLPQEARVKPTNLKKAIDDIKIDTAVLSPSEKDLLKTLETIKSEIEPQSKLISQYGPIKIPIQDFDVNKLIGTKKSLNSIIKWDMDEGVKNQLRKVQKAISKDITEYGKTNPEWYKIFKEADSLFGKVAKREKLESLLSDKSINPAMDNLSYNALSKSINAPGKGELIKKQVDPETFAKIEKLGAVAKAMAIKSKNIPNPSGTAMTAATLGVVSGLIANPIATLSGSGVASILGARIGSQLLTDKKFLDLALKLAEKPNLVSVVPLNKRIKDVTGYSAVALNRELQRAQEREEINGL